MRINCKIRNNPQTKNGKPEQPTSAAVGFDFEIEFEFHEAFHVGIMTFRWEFFKFYEANEWSGYIPYTTLESRWLWFVFPLQQMPEKYINFPSLLSLVSFRSLLLFSHGLESLTDFFCKVQQVAAVARFWNSKRVHTPHRAIWQRFATLVPQAIHRWLNFHDQTNLLNMIDQCFGI